MRSNLLGMCSAVAAVAVAGSAMAGFVDTFDTPLSGGSVVNGVLSSGFSGWSALGNDSDLFSHRRARISGSSTGSVTVTSTIGGGSWTSTIAAEAGGRFPTLEYSNQAGNPDPEGPYTDFTQISTISVTLSGVSGPGFVSFTIWTSGNLYGDTLVAANGTLTLDIQAFISASESDPELDVNWQQTTGLWVSFSRDSVPAGASLTMSNFSYTLVPAPGAAALLGVAGLISARRRKA